MIRKVWACEDCGWEWPLATEPPEGTECDNCGGDLEKVDPVFVAVIDTIEAVLPGGWSMTQAESAEVWVRDCACECFLCSEGIGHCDERPDCQEVFTRDGLVPYDGPTTEDEL